MGRIERGGGDGGEPARSPPGWLEISPAARLHGAAVSNFGRVEALISSARPLPSFRIFKRQQFQFLQVQFRLLALCHSDSVAKSTEIGRA